MDDVLNTAPAGFLSFADDGTILLANARLIDRLGYKAGELEGRHIETILSSGGRIFYHTHFFPMLKMQGFADEIYFSLRCKTGEELPVLTNAVRLERGGRPVNDCVMIRMQQRHLYEDELLRARKAADVASAAKARFLSMMSHDLRTPLTAIAGYAGLLAKGIDGPLNDEQREDVEAIRDAVQQMLALMNDILSFAQLESGRIQVKPQPVVIAEAIDRAEILMRVQFTDRNLKFVRDRCPVDVIASADSARLQQVLLNLLTNAAKFTQPGGTISVRCERRGSAVAIDVSDTGVGIPQDRLSEIFEPFVQVRSDKGPPSGHGVGLGLSISRDLTRAMGGDLKVASELGKGSTFTITLPSA